MARLHGLLRLWMRRWVEVKLAEHSARYLDVLGWRKPFIFAGPLCPADIVGRVEERSAIFRTEQILTIVLWRRKLGLHSGSLNRTDAGCSLCLCSRNQDFRPEILMLGFPVSSP